MYTFLGTPYTYPCHTEELKSKKDTEPIAGVNPTFTVTMLTVSHAFQTKDRLARRRKAPSDTLSVRLRIKDTERLEVKRWEKSCHSSSRQKELSDYSHSKLILREKLRIVRGKVHFIMTHQGPQNTHGKSQ